ALDDYAHRGAEELVAAFDELAAGTAKEAPQTGQASHADKITVADAHLDLTAPAEAAIDRARGTSPSPGRWAELDAKRTKVFGLTPAAEAAVSGEAGQLRSWNGTPVLRCGDGWVRVAESHPCGQPRRAAADYLRGHGDIRFDLRPDQGA